MKKIIYNDDQLSEEEITEEVIRCKALIIKDNKLLILNSNSVFHLPGGHLEKGEKLKECLIRELREETGMEFNYSDFESPFFKVEYLNRDYPEKGVNRKNTIYYYKVETDKDINLDNTNYTEDEKKGNTKLEYIDLYNSIDIIKSNIKNNPMNETIAPDMISAINEYLYGEKEEIELFNKDGNTIGKIIKRGGPKYDLLDNEYIGISIIFIENMKGEFLIQKASREKDNKNSSTGGHIDRGESPIECIIRETKEEIGLDIKKEELKEFKSIIQDYKLIYPFYLKKDIDINKLVLQKDEVDYVKFMSKKELEELIDNNNFSKTHSFVYNEVIRS